MNVNTNNLKIVLDGLMRRYQERVPDVQGVIQAMIAEGLISSAADIENDHIAFRTMGVPNLGIRSLEKIFLHFGYQRREPYYFPEKKLDAFWYAPPSPEFPRIFISELRVKELSGRAQEIIYSYTSEVTSDPVDAINLDDAAAVDRFLHSGLWKTPGWSDFQELTAESEYAAWVIYNRYYLNHFTVSVHNLKPGYDTMEGFNAFLERNGFVLNDAGGKIKTSPDGKLAQSSTIARMVNAHFADGVEHAIAGSYVEFAERKLLDPFLHLGKNEIRREHRREGFEAGNADKIFESTYSTQTKKLNQ
ncbi:DUF1338 domain-containing protein [Flavihumibacter profundi]|uniref:DUF1338 domain-containing protein n=1 Tax=Flavihumibacter profundi TaxID=2716883 RepID=UPI001CC72F0C|nr:DUF1338 domain-containing protein [Flavihumibacter profundi]MBZ5855986.1 DUF1338 domain-containing protein [Flavihumibacter profundi]